MQQRTLGVIGRLVVLTVLVLVLPQSETFAGWLSEARLTYTLANSRMVPNNARGIASGPDGRVHVVWSDARNETHEIYYKCFDGVNWTEDTRLTYNANHCAGACIAVGADNRVHIAWHDTRDAGDFEIYCMAGDGIQWSPPQRLTNADGPSDRPSMAIDHAGDLHLVWQDARDGEAREIYYKRKTATGWESEQRLTWDPAPSKYPSVAVDCVGAVHVVWHDERSGNHEIYYKRLKGTHWTQAVRLTDDGACSNYASVCTDITGNVHVAWSDNRDGNFEVYYKKHDGIAWLPDSRLTSAGGNSSTPQVYCDGDGYLHLVWDDERDQNHEIYYKQCNDANWGDDERLTNMSGRSAKPSIAVDETGDVHVVWQDARHGESEIYWKRTREDPIPKPEIVSIQPRRCNTGQGVRLKITGTDFVYPDYVWLTRPGCTRVSCWRVQMNSGSELICDLDLDQTPLGLWDVVVANPDGQKDTLIQGFDVEPGLIWGDETRLTTASAGSFTSRSRCVAEGPDGDVHVVWCDFRDGIREIYHRRREGCHWGEDERLTISDGGMWSPSVASDKFGRTHVVWHASESGGYEVYYGQHNGSEWDQSMRLDRRRGFSLYPDVAVDDSGFVHTVWSDNDSGDFEIYYRFFDGTSWSGGIRLTEAPGASTYPSLAAEPDGGLHLVWQDNRSGSYEIYYRTFNGSLWSDEERISDSQHGASDPSIAVGLDGSAHVVWVDDYWTRKVYHRLKGPSGWEAEELVSHEYDSGSTPSVAVDSSGAVHVVWRDSGDMNRHGGIYWVRSSGGNWKEEALVKTWTTSVRPSIAAGQDGTVHLVWSDDCEGHFEIFHRELSLGPLEPPVIVSVSPAEAYNTFPVEAVIHGMGFISAPTVWLETADGERIVAGDVDRKSPRLIECEIDLSGAVPGSWDLHVVNRDMQEDVLPEALLVSDSPWTKPERVSLGDRSSITSRNNARCVLREPGGVVHVVWHDNRDGDYEIYYRKWGGNAWGSEVQMTECDGESRSPTILLGRGDVPHICWKDKRSGTMEIYHKSFTGRGWGPDLMISRDDSIASESPSMAMDSRGNPIIFYDDGRSGRCVIMCSRWTGTTWDEIQISETGPQGWNPACAADGRGNIHVVWEASTEGRTRIYHRRWDGEAWGEIHMVTENSSSMSPSCCCDGSGNLMVVWWRSSIVRGAICAGEVWSDLGEIAEANSPPSLSASDERFHLVWERDGGVYYKTYRDGWTRRMLVNEIGAYGYGPSVSADQDGRLTVVWTKGDREPKTVMARHWEGDWAVSGVDGETSKPVKFGIAGITPNPFRGSTKIRFGLPLAAKVRIAIYDVRGRLVWEENAGGLEPGLHAVVWNGADRAGKQVSPGIYVARLSSGGKASEGKIVFLR